MASQVSLKGGDADDLSTVAHAERVKQVTQARLHLRLEIRSRFLTEAPGG